MIPLKSDFSVCAQKHAIGNKFYLDSSFYNNSRQDYEEIHKYINNISREESVKPSFHFYPHFVQKESVLFRERIETSWDSDYIFFDKKDVLTLSYEELEKKIIKSGYKKIYRKNNFYIFRK